MSDGITVWSTNEAKHKATLDAVAAARDAQPIGECPAEPTPDELFALGATPYPEEAACLRSVMVTRAAFARLAALEADPLAPRAEITRLRGECRALSARHAEAKATHERAALQRELAAARRDAESALRQSQRYPGNASYAQTAQDAAAKVAELTKRLEA